MSSLNIILADIWIVSSWFFILYPFIPLFQKGLVNFGKLIFLDNQDYSQTNDSIKDILNPNGFTYWSWFFNTIIVTIGYKRFITFFQIKVFQNNFFIPKILLRIFIGTAWFGYLWTQFSRFPPDVSSSDNEEEDTNGFRKVISFFMQSYIILAMIIWVSYSYKSLVDLVKPVLNSNRGTFIWQGMLIPIIYCIQDILRTSANGAGGFQVNKYLFKRNKKIYYYSLSLILLFLSLTSTHTIFEDILIQN